MNVDSIGGINILRSEHFSDVIVHTAFCGEFSVFSCAVIYKYIFL